MILPSLPPLPLPHPRNLFDGLTVPTGCPPDPAERMGMGIVTPDVELSGFWKFLCKGKGEVLLLKGKGNGDVPRGTNRLGNASASASEWFTVS